MSFFARNWRVMAVGLASGALIEGLLIKGRFYEQMKSARARDLDRDWAELDEQSKAAVLRIEQRYRKVKSEKE